MKSRSVFEEKLHAAGPQPDLAGPLGLYGRFVGDWTMEAEEYLPDGRTERASGEIHFGWILGGRAIQDVWIMPGHFHGTTLRVYDPRLEAWHILWSEPFKQYYQRMIGRALGPDIVQDAESERGPIRWSFVDIADDSFRWTSAHMDREGVWCTDANIRVRRT